MRESLLSLRLISRPAREVRPCLAGQGAPVWAVGGRPAVFSREIARFAPRPHVPVDSFLAELRAREASPRVTG